MHQLYLLLRMLLASGAFIFLGIMVLIIPLDASPIWPVDGVLAILGGIGIGWFAFVSREEMRDEDPDNESDLP